jgi:hypothetical protein
VVAPWIIHFMSETPNYETEPTTSPVTTTPAPATLDERTTYVEPARKPNRLFQIAAWVAIVAGSVFIVAVIFFTGFALGAHSGGGHHGGHHRQDMGMMHHDGPPGMQMRPGFVFPMGPGAFGPGGPGMFPGGPGGQGGQGGQGFGPGPGNGPGFGNGNGNGNAGPSQGQQPPAPGTQQRPS